MFQSTGHCAHVVNMNNNNIFVAYIVLQDMEEYETFGNGWQRFAAIQLGMVKMFQMWLEMVRNGRQ